MQTLERKFDLGIKKIQGNLSSQKTLGLFHSFHFFSHFPVFRSPAPHPSHLCVQEYSFIPQLQAQPYLGRKCFCCTGVHYKMYTLFSTQSCLIYIQIWRQRKSIKSSPKLHYYHRIIIYCWDFTLILFYQSAAFVGFFFPPGIPNSSSVKVVHKPILCTRKVQGKITACYSTKNPANGYDFPKYNQVSGWLAGWLDVYMTKEKLCIVSLPVKFRQTLFLAFEL